MVLDTSLLRPRMVQGPFVKAVSHLPYCNTIMILNLLKHQSKDDTATQRMTVGHEYMQGVVVATMVAVE